MRVTTALYCLQEIQPNILINNRFILNPLNNVEPKPDIGKDYYWCIWLNKGLGYLLQSFLQLIISTLWKVSIPPNQKLINVAKYRMEDLI